MLEDYLDENPSREITVTYGYAGTCFGKVVVVFYDGLVKVIDFVLTKREQEKFEAMVHMLSVLCDVPVIQDNDRAQDTIDKVFSGGDVNLDIKGSRFQLTVWEELLKLRKGETVSYEELARRIGRPDATRAVASAVAENPIALIIPCHRVIHKSGEIGNYKWGKDLKRKMLTYEQTALNSQTTAKRA